jgi:hypothetical protein
MPKYNVICLWPDRIIEASSEEKARFMAMEMIERADFDVQEIDDEDSQHASIPENK